MSAKRIGVYDKTNWVLPQPQSPAAESSSPLREPWCWSSGADVTVRELIEALQAFPPEMVVERGDPEDSNVPIEKVEIRHIAGYGVESPYDAVVID